MRISTEWLQQFVTVPPDDELAHVFEMAGIGVEEHDDDGFSLEVTSNRGDWLSVIGLAREVAAMTDARLHAPSRVVEDNGEPMAGRVTVNIENADDCPRYVARLIENVHIGVSPEWMQRRLIASGMRPINNVVDVTNYVMLEMGQPLHAFDADKVQGGGIVVRRAQAGEKIVTLDEVERELDEEVLLIAAASGALAIAGIMGGRDSEVTAATTRILLESAHFSPVQVRRGVRKVGLSSEASRRFERWVDPNGVLRAADRAAQLLAECAGGTVAHGAVDEYLQPVPDAAVTLRTARCNALLGLTLSTEIISSTLERLRFRVTPDEGAVQVLVPTWRRDIEREADLIEEVARIYGYDRIPTTLSQGANSGAGLSLAQRLQERARSALLRCGLTEVVTYSLQNAAAVERAGQSSQPAVRLSNPLSEDYTQLRTSLIPSLLEVLGNNAQRNARIFDLGKTYLPQGESQQPNERRRLGLALLDAPPAPHWQKAAAPVDFYVLKGMVETLLKVLGAPAPRYQAVSDAPFHPGRAAALSLDDEVLGVMGEVHPEVRERYELRHRAYLAEIDFDVLVRHVALTTKYQPLPRFPSADRDLALVLSTATVAAEVDATIRAAGGPLLESVQIFDVYGGPPIPAGHKSLALALRFRAPDRTLTDDEVDAAMKSIVSTAERSLGAQLRA
ncbi:MAG TPA: phenylalanine--tRNA ligase subunit beta [Abditibacteriaceae bacterium]|nr:phenylalanine--tRNA ligase subunit beta [Abditibacteriaceae bacterium]